MILVVDHLWKDPSKSTVEMMVAIRKKENIKSHSSQLETSEHQNPFMNRTLNNCQ